MKNNYTICLENEYKSLENLVEALSPLLFSAGISSMVKALTPYVTIFLSAQIINELSGNRDVDVLANG